MKQNAKMQDLTPIFRRRKNIAAVYIFLVDGDRKGPAEKRYRPGDHCKKDDRPPRKTQAGGGSVRPAPAGLIDPG